MMDVRWNALSPNRSVEGVDVVGAAALLRIQGGRPVDHWQLDPLQEIRGGTTEPSASEHRLPTVTRFMTGANL